MTSTLFRTADTPRTGGASPSGARLVEHATLAWSLLLAGAGATWWLDPDRYPIDPDDGSGAMSLVAWSPTPSVGVLAVAAGLVGALTAWHARRATNGLTGRAVTVVAAVFATFFLIVAPDIRVLVLLGYAAALLGPLVLAGLVVRSARRSVVARVALSLGLVAVAAGIVVLDLDASDAAEFATGLGGGLARGGPGMLAVSLGLVGGCLWAATLVRHRRRTRGACLSCGDATTSPGDPARWGTWVTVAAALGPLPYGLTRLTWLTPWPFLMDPTELAAHPATRIFGLSLGLAALGSSVLVIGLLRPWGERFPRWVPTVGGRPVPVLFPSLTAVVVGVAITAAGRSLVQQLLAEESLRGLGAETLVVFPFPVWGPLLVAAGVAYYLRHRRCDDCAGG